MGTQHGRDATDAPLHNLPDRRDAAATRLRLLEAVGELMVERRLDWELADVATQAGTAVATAYRHLGSKDEALDLYMRRLVDDLAERLQTVRDTHVGQAAILAMCREWVELACEWGPAAVYVRSPRGLVERMHAADPILERIWTVVQPAVTEAIERGELPPQHVEYAVVVWLTLLDERVVVDLHRYLGWSPSRIADHLGTTLLRGLGADGPGPDGP